MKLAFMSSVMPKAALADLLAQGTKHGYQGIEFRPEWSQAHGVELTASAKERKAVRKKLAEGGLDPCCLAPGIRFHEDEPGKRDAQLELLNRHIQLAADVGIGRVRVFADPLPNKGAGLRSANLAAQADYLARGAVKAHALGIRLVLETHANCRAADVAEILWRAAYPPGLWINWHLAHCLNHGEDVDEAYRHVKGRVAHVHFALSAEKHEDISYIIRQAQLLAWEGYDGYFSVEAINPPDSDMAMKTHADGWKKILAAIGR